MIFTTKVQISELQGYYSTEFCTNQPKLEQMFCFCILAQSETGILYEYVRKNTIFM